MPKRIVGFVSFVMIPLFELLAKVLPNMDEEIIKPIRGALDFYKQLFERQKASEGKIGIC